MYQNIATKVLTGEVRLSFCHLNEPSLRKDAAPGEKPRYSVTLLIPKTDLATKADIDSAIRAAYEDGVANKWKGLRPEMASPLIWDGDGRRKGGDEFGPECKGHWVITANTPDNTRKPQVVDISNINVELAPKDVYSGMYARVTLNFFSYSRGNKGVGCGLGNVMKTRDGEPLSGGASAASDFEGIGQTVVSGTGYQTGSATPGYGAAMPATPGQMTYQNTGVAGINPFTGQPMNSPQINPQINPITGLPM